MDDGITKEIVFAISWQYVELNMYIFSCLKLQTKVKVSSSHCCSE